MAEYRYRCQGCQHVFDVEHSVSNTAVVLCPVCEDRAIRLFDTAPAVITKSSKSHQHAQASLDTADSKGNTTEEDAKEPHECGCAWHACFHTK